MNKKAMISIATVLVLAIAGFFVYKSMTAVKVADVNLTEQQQKISEYKHPESIITPEELNALLVDGKEDIVVIGTMKSADQVIDGSYVVWRDNYSGTDAFPYGGMINTKEELEAMLSEFGVNQDTTIVTYAANDQHDSARLFWTFKVLGHENVRLLDGGMNAWLGAGFEAGAVAKAGDRPATEYKAADYNVAKYDASLDMVKQAVGNDDYIILDTRSESEETGADTKKGAFGPGKIKGATFLEYKIATKENGTFKTKAELEEIYKDVLSSDKEVIAYCQSGVRSAYTWFVLTQILGYEDVLNYDGSWIEWSYYGYDQKDASVKDLTENGKF
ncbi:sulfurtransferase [Bacillus salinus]|uniref:sulfurtransferase n=1 Tax=Bacillus sp. HMF5848 TaxID=2495421 RepID=UPI0016397261|nr:rhodanese-like domain-containing protein [Bacillus sp. HMF5848]